eukprot:g7422.t1
MLNCAILLPLLFGARLLLSTAQVPGEMGKRRKVAKAEKVLGVEPAMPHPEERRKKAVDKLRLRHANKHNKIEEEELRLAKLYQEWAQRREQLERSAEFEECQRLTAVNVNRISDFYVGYDAEYGTKKLSPLLLHKVATAANYLSQEKREMVYGKNGFMNRGYLVEGTLPVYGAWPGGRTLTKKEKQDVEAARDCLNMRRAEIDAHTKLRDHPYDFETDFVLQKCFAAVDKLCGTPMATWIPEKSIDGKAWVWPYFGIGQRRDPDTGAWTKVRPIANEKLRSRVMSPATEHMTLPSTSTIADLIMRCANPNFEFTVAQTKNDVTKSVTANRAEKGKGPQKKMVWADINTIPKGIGAYRGEAFCPTLGKLDLHQAYYQLGADCPDRNVFQCYNPETGHYQYGKMSLTSIHMHYFRKFLALMGLAVAPEKCEFVEYGGTLEVLGILFTVYEDHIVYKQLGWLTEEQLGKHPLEKAAKKPNNHYNGIRKKLELWVETEKDSKRTRAQNVAPYKYSQMWPMSDQVTLFIWPEEAHHCMVKGGTEGRNSKFRVWVYYCLNYIPDAFFAAQLQTLTFDNLTRCKTKFTPEKAAPPDLSRVTGLTLREQAIFGMWTCTGLRKDSFCSIRADMVHLVCPECKFVRATVPCIKSIPTPGEVFYVFIPADVFYIDVFPVEKEECDRIALKLNTTSHGVRRALALYLRRLAGEVGLMPSPDLAESKQCLKYKKKISEFFGWSDSSSQWITEYSRDVVLHLNTAFWVRPLVEQWFLTDL